MRKPRTDDRWYRTSTGLFVPRRPTLPTRRYINPLGSTSCECCDTTPDGCYLWTTSRPASVDIDIAGVVDDYCDDCPGDATHEVSYLNSTTIGDGYCDDNFKSTLGAIEPTVVFSSFLSGGSTWTWRVQASVPMTTTCQWTDGFTFEWFNRQVFAFLEQSVAFQTGQTYDLGAVYSDSAGTPLEYACDTSAGTMSVTT